MPTTRLERIRHNPIRRTLQIARMEAAGRNFVRLTLRGAELAGFTSLGFDDHLKFIVRGANGEEIKRDITPRRFDAAAVELDLEIAVHDGGALSDWLVGASVGDNLTIGGPKTSVVIPVDYPWHVLIGDLTAVPAIGRRVEELGPEAPTLIIVRAIDDGDRQLLPAGGENRQVTWTYDDETFTDALTRLALPMGEGFVWAAGEAGLMARVRREFVERRGHSRSATRISGYWKLDEQGFHETLERGEG